MLILAAPSAELEQGNRQTDTIPSSVYTWDNDAFDISTPGTSRDGSLDFPLNYPRINATQTAMDVLASAGITLDMAGRYLEQFKSMCCYFPFIVIPKDASILHLARHSPFVSLSAIAAASSSSSSVQRQLEQVLRVSLLQKLFIEGDRDLDLLQGLLIYLSWYQFYCTPRRDQSYMLTQMAVSMCTDLGLDITPSEACSSRVGLRLSHYRKHSSKDVEHDEFYSREARRSYLGTYYLSSHISASVGKPSRIHITDYMLRCAQSLAMDLEVESDSMLLQLIQLQQLSDEYHGHLLLARNRCQDQRNIAIINTHMEAFKDQMGIWERQRASDGRYDWFTKSAFNFAQLHAYELDMVNPLAKRNLNSTRGPSETGPSHFKASTRLEVLLLCFEAAKNFCETFLTLPESEYRQISFIQWTNLICATVTVYRLSVGLLSISEWDVRFARHSFDLDHFFTSLVKRVNRVILDDESQKPTTKIATTPLPPDQQSASPTRLFTMLPSIYENVQQTWDRLKQLPQDESAKDTAQVHQTEFPPPAVVNKKTSRRCPAHSFWEGQSHDLDIGLELGMMLEPADDEFGVHPRVGVEVSGLFGGGDGIAEGSGIGSTFMMEQGSWNDDLEPFRGGSDWSV